MPSSAPKPCNHPGCNAYAVIKGRCNEHAAKVQSQTEARRGSSTERGYGYKWQQASKGFLRSHPLCECEECQAGELRIKQASVVDHIIDHKLKEAMDSGNDGKIKKAKILFWDKDNWRSMAKDCHDKKTGKMYGFSKAGAGQISTVNKT